MPNGTEMLRCGPVSYTHLDVYKRQGIDMGCDDGLLKIVITDNGIPFNPLETREPDITLPLEERPIGGLGIFLVKQLMTDVRYDRSEGKNRLTMTKEIQ